MKQCSLIFTILFILHLTTLANNEKQNLKFYQDIDNGGFLGDLSEQQLQWLLLLT